LRQKICGKKILGKKIAAKKLRRKIAAESWQQNRSNKMWTAKSRQQNRGKNQTKSHDNKIVAIESATETDP
jgi:hypothetical protein